MLVRALRSLHTQTVPPAEILVVDNAPTSAEAEQRVRTEFPAVRYVLEPVPGLDFARNRAIAEATTDVVAFLDDDAVAEGDWVAATGHAFATLPRLGALTGHVAPIGAGTEGERLFEANGGFARGAEPIHVSPDPVPGSAGAPGHTRLRRAAPLIAWSISIGSGCSMAVSRSAVQHIGGFDDALDLGDALPGGGDLDILWRLLVAGWDVRYEPAVRALHEHRPDAEGAIRQICGHNRALVAWLTKCAVQARGRSRLEVLLFLGWRLAKPGVRLARRAVGRDPLPARALLRLWAHCWRGLAGYPAARRVADRRRASVAAAAAMPGTGTT